MSNTVDEKSCPFCGGVNACGMAGGRPCWCVAVEVPAALIDLLPAHLKHKACICAACVRRFHDDPTRFAADLRASASSTAGLQGRSRRGGL